MTGTFKKILTVILAIVMVAALLLGCVACSNPTADDDDKKGNGGTNNNETNKGENNDNEEDNSSKYEGLSDTEYFQTLALDSMEDTVTSLSATVGLYKDLVGATLTDFGAKADLELMLGDMMIDLVENAIFGTTESGMDMSFLSNIGLGLEIDATEEIAQIAVDLNLSNTEIVKLLLLANEESLWAGAPDLVDGYLKADFADLGIDLDAITASTPSVMGMLPNIIPDENTTATILNRYLELALKEIDNVERTTETLTLDGLSQEATKLTVKIYEQDALDAVKAVLKAAKTDADIKKVVEDFGDFYNDMMAEMNAEYDIDYEDVDAYAEFTKLIDEALNQLPAQAETTDSYIGLILYVDDNHNVIGCALDMGVIYTQTVPNVSTNGAAANSTSTSNQESYIVFSYYTVTEGNNFKTVFEIAEEMKVTGSGTINNGKIDGTFAFTADGITGLTIELKNFDTNNRDAVSGTMIIKPTKDLLSQMDGIDELPFDDIGLQLDLDVTSDKYNVTLKLIGDDAMVVGLALKLATKTPGNIKAPVNTVDVTDQQAFMNWVAGIDFGEIVDNLEDAGVPDSLLTALESLVPAM